MEGNSSSIDKEVQRLVDVKLPRLEVTEEVKIISQAAENDISYGSRGYAAAHAASELRKYKKK